MAGPIQLVLLSAFAVTLTSALFSDLWHLDYIHPLDILKYRPGFKIRRDWVPRSCYDGRSTPVRSGDFIHQHYIGRLVDGTKFDASYDRNGTFNFFMGMGAVITGIDVGMKGMCKWERRDITIPPSMGYGSRQVGSIPPDSTLEFEVVLDDTWISPFNIKTVYKPDGCDRELRKTAQGDRISIWFNGTIDRNESAVVEFLPRDDPLSFVLGEGNVIKALDMGLLDMCIGEKRIITAPSKLAYEWGKYPLIPPQTTLQYEVELLDITDGKMYYIQTVAPGCPSNETSQHGDLVSIDYSGISAYNKFRQWNRRGSPYTFQIGGDHVLRAFNFAAEGMCIGEKRRLFMPPEFVTAQFHTAKFPIGKRLTLDIELKMNDFGKLYDSTTTTTTTTTTTPTPTTAFEFFEPVTASFNPVVTNENTPILASSPIDVASASDGAPAF